MMDRHRLLYSLWPWLLVMVVMNSLVTLLFTPHPAMANDNLRYRMESAPAPHPKMWGTPGQEQGGEPASLSVIIQVNTPGYVPARVEVRTRISTELFTSIIAAEDLPGLLEDPNVLSVEQSQTLR